GYLDLLRVPYRPEEIRYHAHPIPVWGGRERLNTRDGRVLLAGDAAGLVNPLFGDGILHALRSGLIAAQCLAEGRPQEYTRRIHAEFAAGFDAAMALAGLFYASAEVLYQHGVRRPGATRAAARLLAGEALTADLPTLALRRVRELLAGLPVPSLK
ncbi:MAG TPA: geranylgeranyl reductase, partial [Armatimonadota bacterium]|nr:geranylgeranyl reductase [Armatimonadota bacterium]